MSDITKCTKNSIKHLNSNCPNTSYLARCIIPHQRSTFRHRFICREPVPIRSHMKRATIVQNPILSGFQVAIRSNQKFTITLISHHNTGFTRFLLLFSLLARHSLFLILQLVTLSFDAALFLAIIASLLSIPGFIPGF